MTRILVNEPVLGDRELELVTDCLHTGWISSAGRYIEQFEERWASYCGMQYGIAVSNGTSALQLAVACLELEPGDEVIVPTFTIISCALAVLYNGGVPVLVDAEPRTWCMDPDRVESLIGPRARAIMPVHIYGHPVDIDPIREMAGRHGLAIVEDAAEAHGAEYLTGHSAPEDTGHSRPGDRGASSCSNRLKPEWKRCGGLGDLSAFSFYANKLITTGEGGMVLTNDARLAERARSQRNLCFRSDRRFLHTALGNNFRLTNLQAAIGLAQMERIGEIVARKRWMGRAYTERLQDVAGLQLPVEESWARQVYWMYGVVLDEETGIDAMQFADELRERGVETRPFFLGMHEQPVLKERVIVPSGSSGSYPVAERIARRGLYLPSGLGLTEQQLERVCEAVREVLT